MYVLGIETSCDDTSCAVLKGRKILSNVTISSLREHKKYGGIVPEIAHRNHLKVVDCVLKIALEVAKISLRDIDLIAVTYRPGLKGSLLVGVNFAKGLSMALDVPLIGIDHLHAHIFAPFVDNNKKIPLPFIGVVISGGHTEIMLVRDFNSIKTIYTTVDDACGEVFDKVGRAFKLGYPAGPIIDRLFDYRYKDSFNFKCGKIPNRGLSFSGIKSGLIYKKLAWEKDKKIDRKTTVIFLSSFQESVMQTIVGAIFEVCNKYRIKNIVCGGGVVANSRFRELILQDKNYNVYLPPLKLCIDNGAMVGGLGYYLYKNNIVQSNLSLDIITN